MKTPKNALKKYRDSIDRVDAGIVRLLNERARNVLAIKRIKDEGAHSFYAPHREMEVYRRVAKLNHGPFPTETLTTIFCEIMSRRLSSPALA